MSSSEKGFVVADHVTTNHLLFPPKGLEESKVKCLATVNSFHGKIFLVLDFGSALVVPLIRASGIWYRAPILPEMYQCTNVPICWYSSGNNRADDISQLLCLTVFISRPWLPTEVLDKVVVVCLSNESVSLYRRMVEN